jgi:hypothetical protein
VLSAGNDIAAFGLFRFFQLECFRRMEFFKELGWYSFMSGDGKLF